MNEKGGKRGEGKGREWGTAEEREGTGFGPEWNAEERIQRIQSYTFLIHDTCIHAHKRHNFLSQVIVWEF